MTRYVFILTNLFSFIQIQAFYLFISPFFSKTVFALTYFPPSLPSSLLSSTNTQQQLALHEKGELKRLLTAAKDL